MAPWRAWPVSAHQVLLPPPSTQYRASTMGIARFLVLLHRLRAARFSRYRPIFYFSPDLALWQVLSATTRAAALGSDDASPHPERIPGRGRGRRHERRRRRRSPRRRGPSFEEGDEWRCPSREPQNQAWLQAKSFEHQLPSTSTAKILAIPLALPRSLLWGRGD